jgi:hypothetical protein
LSGKLAEHITRPEMPPMAGPMGEAASPVCTPIIPVTALNGCWVPDPETKPARRR